MIHAGMLKVNVVLMVWCFFLIKISILVVYYITHQIITFSWLMPGTPPEVGVQEASDIDARATSAGSSWCGGAAALLRAPPGWQSSSPYL